MNLQKVLSQILPSQRPASMPLALEELRRIGRALLGWRRKLSLPALTEEQLRDLGRRPIPGGGRLITVCADILRRRPDIAAELGVTADELESFARAASAIEGVGDQVARVLRALQDALLLHTQDVARHNRAAEAAFAQVAEDPTVPSAERQSARVALGRMRTLGEVRAARIARRGKSAARRLGPLAQAIAATTDARDRTRGALSVLRGLGRRAPQEE